MKVGILLAALGRGNVVVIRRYLRLWVLVLWALVLRVLILRVPVLWVVLVVVAVVLWRARGSTDGCGCVYRGGSRCIRGSRCVRGVGRGARVGCAGSRRVGTAV